MECQDQNLDSLTQVPYMKVECSRSYVVPQRSTNQDGSLTRDSNFWSLHIFFFFKHITICLQAQFKWAYYCNFNFSSGRVCDRVNKSHGNQLTDVSTFLLLVLEFVSEILQLHWILKALIQIIFCCTVTSAVSKMQIYPSMINIQGTI